MDEIVISFRYAVPTDKTLWVQRMEKACCILEAFSQRRLSTTSGGTKYNARDIVITDRNKYLKKCLKLKTRRFSLNGHRISIFGSFYEWGGKVFNFGLILNCSSSKRDEIESFFVAVGDAVNACNASYSPPSVLRKLHGYNLLAHGVYKNLVKPENLADQMKNIQWESMLESKRLMEELNLLMRSLPILSNDPFRVRESSAHPLELGWLNYWSPESCEYIGFPDPERDRDLLAHSYQTPTGAWLVKLCPEPLDLDRPDHLALFADVYQRFPKIGLREDVSAPPLSFRYPEHTCYINSTLETVSEHVNRLFQTRGYRLIEDIPQIAESADITVGLIQGENDWTIIKTLPEGIMGQPLSEDKEPFLVEFCLEIGCSGFVLDVYSEFEALLLESDGAGHVSQSGIRSFNALSADVDFEAMEESGRSPLLRFQLLPLEIETDVGDYDDYGQVALQVHDLLAGQQSDFCADEAFESAIKGDEFQNRQGIKLCFIQKQK